MCIYIYIHISTRKEKKTVEPSLAKNPNQGHWNKNFLQNRNSGSWKNLPFQQTACVSFAKSHAHVDHPKDSQQPCRPQSWPPNFWTKLRCLQECPRVKVPRKNPLDEGNYKFSIGIEGFRFSGTRGPFLNGNICNESHHSGKTHLWNAKFLFYVGWRATA